MRVPLSWLREYVDLPPVTAREVADALISVGLEVEQVEAVAHEVKNIVTGEVLELEDLTEFRKPVRCCRVEVGETEPRGIICGATNFAAGDRVAVALPGAVLPGGFEIGSRKTYGRVSDGMICSAQELAIDAEHSGILVLGADTPVGADAVELLGLRDDVLDIAVTPDRGYCVSIRGVAREVATAFGVAFHDPANVELPATDTEGESYPAGIADPSACDRFVLREITGFDPNATSPLWMRRRLHLAGMRQISLAVDITNYVMHELGQPLHAFDRSKLSGEIVVRRAEEGERLETLDHVVRDLDPDDILITDSSGPISMAGTMGGLHTEIDESSTDMVVEAAHFSAAGIARESRRHQLSSEASYRFERGVDRELPLRASAKAVRMLAELGGATPAPGVTHAQVDQPAVTVTMPAGHPDRVAGMTYGCDTVVRRLRDVGCVVESVAEGGAELAVTPPSWRPDLREPNDLAEEVIRLEGYAELPSELPYAPAGRGLTEDQRQRRRVGRALAAVGYVEVLSYPFVSARDWDRLLLDEDDPRRRALRLANPLAESEPWLRTTLLPGLLRALARNVGRGNTDVGLYEMGQVYRPCPDAPGTAPRLPVDRGPTTREVASVEAALPYQPQHVAVVLAGEREPSGWWGNGRPAGWADAVEAARGVGRACGIEVTVHAGRHAPWHPGRCAELRVGNRVVGHAGELHPRAVQAYELPRRACAVELELPRVDAGTQTPVRAPRMSAFPVATLDVALLVDTSVPAGEVESALADGAGELLESLRLFDVYTGEQVGEGRKSLAYALRFRSPDRTLTTEEASRARDGAVAEAARRTGASLRAG